MLLLLYVLLTRTHRPQASQEAVMLRILDGLSGEERHEVLQRIEYMVADSIHMVADWVHSVARSGVGPAARTRRAVRGGRNLMKW